MTTINIPLQVTVTTASVTVIVAGQSTTISVPTAPVVPPVVPPAGQSAMVYSKGKFLWMGDWSFSATPNYSDITANPTAGPFDLMVTTQKWGGWQPYFNSGAQTNPALAFDTTPYAFLNFQAQPFVANQTFQMNVLSAGDTPDGVAVSATGYATNGANPPLGVWTQYKVPLSAFKLTDKQILKFSISDQTGLASNKWALQEVGFSAS